MSSALGAAVPLTKGGGAHPWVPFIPFQKEAVGHWGLQE